jgi:RES domain-containing protein
VLDGLTIIREAAFPRTVRLVTTARLRQSVLKGLVGDDELEALAEIEGATSNRLLAQHRGAGDVKPFELVYGVPHAAIINASFAYAKPREPSRFNGAERGAWYASLAVETSLAEVAFHMTDFLARTGHYGAVVEYAEMFASFAGEFVDLRPHPDHQCLHPDKAIGYPAGNAVADGARARGINGIIYPSVRHPGGTCLAALFPHAVQSVTQGDVYRLKWAGTPVPKVEKVARPGA